MAAAVAVVVLYVTVALLTRAAHEPVRPLFEGVGPPPAYQWVNPPSRFAPGNVKPSAGKQPITFANDVSQAAAVVTPDQQLLAGLDAGSIAPHAGDSSAEATITPLDPATLGPLPAGLAPDGNAYHLDIVYRPSGTPVTTFAKSVPLTLNVPSPAQVLLYSADGRTWQQQPAQHSAGSSTASGTFAAPGFILAAGPPGTVPVAGKAKGSDAGRVILAVVVVALLAAALVAVPVVVRRRRDRRPPPPPARGRGNQAPGRRARPSQGGGNRRRR